jgi:hypothetical protein
VALAALALLLSGCGPTKFEVELNVPPPLVSRIPIVVGVYVPEEFRTRVYEEKRRDYSISVSIGKAQSDGYVRLMNAMFLRAVPVQGHDCRVGDGPRDARHLRAGARGFFIHHATRLERARVRRQRQVPHQRLQAGRARSSTRGRFTGYGSVESSTMGLKGTNALKAATGLAMRDAAAKLAAEFREQAIVRGLLPSDAPLTPVVRAGWQRSRAASGTRRARRRRTACQPPPRKRVPARWGDRIPAPAGQHHRRQTVAAVARRRPVRALRSRGGAPAERRHSRVADGAASLRAPQTRRTVAAGAATALACAAASVASGFLALLDRLVIRLREAHVRASRPACRRRSAAGSARCRPPRVPPRPCARRLRSIRACVRDASLGADGQVDLDRACDDFVRRRLAYRFQSVARRVVQQDRLAEQQLAQRLAVESGALSCGGPSQLVLRTAQRSCCSGV